MGRGPQAKHPIKTTRSMTSVLSPCSCQVLKTLQDSNSTIKHPRPAGKLILAQAPAAWGRLGHWSPQGLPARARLWGDSEAMFPAVTKEERQGARHWPDELGSQGRTETWAPGIFSYFTDHALRLTNKAREGVGGKLGLSVNVYVLLLRLSAE